MFQTIIARIGHKYLYILVFSFALAHCGGLSPDLSSSASDVSSESTTRLVTGSFGATSSSSYYLTAKKPASSGCGIDQVIAVDATGESIVGKVDSSCSFGLKLKIGRSYIISFTRGGSFVATMMFNRIASSVLPIAKDDRPLDLGKISVMGKTAICDREDETICEIDTDGDGVSICDEMDENEFEDETHEFEDEHENEFEDEESCDPDHKVEICHVPPGNPDNAHTICVDYHSVKYVSHLKHGDTIGECYSEEEDEEEIESEDDEFDEENDLDDEELNVACHHPMRARFDFLKIMNWNGGDLETLVFLGTEDKPVPGGAWFALTDETGKIIIDDYVKMDVPGIALQRGVGWIHFNFWGYHPPREGKESLIGLLALEGAGITYVVNDRRGKFEHQGDGIAMFGRPGQDEYEIASETMLKVTATVTVHRDGFRVYYRPQLLEAGCLDE